MGTWLLERGHTMRYGSAFNPERLGDHADLFVPHSDYSYMGTHREGCGGTWEQIVHQGLAPEAILQRIRSLLE